MHSQNDLNNSPEMVDTAHNRPCCNYTVLAHAIQGTVLFLTHILAELPMVPFFTSLCTVACNMITRAVQTLVRTGTTTV